MADAEVGAADRTASRGPVLQDEGRVLRRRLPPAAAAVLLLALRPASSVVRGQVVDRAVQQAVSRGVEFLKGHQQPDGSWPYRGHDVGMTALATLALAESGLPADDPAVQSGCRYVRNKARYETQTYDIALAILLLSRIGATGDQPLIRQLGRRLAAGQLSSGGWTYWCPVEAEDGTRPRLTNRPIGRPGRVPRPAGRIVASGRRRRGTGDNSNTQFAVLGVWAAGRAGLDTTAVMELVDRRFRTTQSSHGGWSYRGSGPDTPAMTCAGLMSLVLAKGQQKLQGKLSRGSLGAIAAGKRSRAGRMHSDQQIDRGIQRVAQFVASMGPQSRLYFMWSVERVGVALRTSRIGAIDWYARGSAILLQTQLPDGSWQTAHGPLVDTSFALLFLRRSNLAQGVPQLITKSRAIDRSSGAKLRAGSLKELLRTVKEPAHNKQPAAKTTSDHP